MVTHATAQAIGVLSGSHGVEEWPLYTAACDWEKRTPNGLDGTLTTLNADVLMGGSKLSWKIQLPTCPTCALFVDLALQESGLTCGENVEAT